MLTSDRGCTYIYLLFTFVFLLEYFTKKEKEKTNMWKLVDQLHLKDIASENRFHRYLRIIIILSLLSSCHYCENHFGQKI